ncbi:Ypt/Rab-GAP domain of gyp1p superfamily protein [Zea mays]|uniref:Ypt/Rab-GAP domain of gyp1p superfamily protein n=1 Tax=Zea mays TaxID=4577 RepID=A0A1D6PTB2_MAIZE|nr:Ypt/Rab-GAP domain of gyp1p superfamily protein [Zea mays]
MSELETPKTARGVPTRSHEMVWRETVEASPAEVHTGPSPRRSTTRLLSALHHLPAILLVDRHQVFTPAQPPLLVTELRPCYGRSAYVQLQGGGARRGKEGLFIGVHRTTRGGTRSVVIPSPELGPPHLRGAEAKRTGQRCGRRRRSSSRRGAVVTGGGRGGVGGRGWVRGRRHTVGTSASWLYLVETIVVKATELFLPFKR